MESFLSRFKNPLVLIALLLVQAVGLATQVRRPADALHPDGDTVRLVRLWAGLVVSPFERASAASGRGLRAAWADYVNLRHVRQRNDDLQKQLAQMKLERAAISEDAVEAQRLRQLLDFRQHYIAKTVAAQVIGTSGSDQSRLLLLDKGTSDGLRPGMPVITPDGVVGKLRDVFRDTAQLLLLNDPTSGAGVFLQTTRTKAVLKGTATGELIINNLAADERVKPGEQVLTSGGDQVYPRGLAVGTIGSVKPDREHQPYTLIVLKPAANLYRLEEVLVITETANSLNPKTEEELMEEAQANSADLSTSRLPSVHDAKEEGADPNAAPDAMPPSDNSTQLVPKPKPAMHPDRYSPGTALPAAELTPGGGKPVADPEGAKPQ